MLEDWEEKCKCGKVEIEPHPCPSAVGLDGADAEDSILWCKCCPWCTQKCKDEVIESQTLEV